MTLGRIVANLLPQLGLSNESKKAKSASGALWHLELHQLGLHKDLDGLYTYTHCLHIVCLHLLQAFLAVFLDKAHVPQ